MSEAVRDLLVRGVAATRAKENDEARHYLEWVLMRDDADSDQRIEAWLSLAEISSDPVEQRDCFENVLAYLPSNVAARQGMAFLDGRLKREDMLDPFKPQQALGATAVDSTVRRYTCPNCGGKTSFSAGEQALLCAYCGARLNEAVAPPTLVDERDFISTLPTASAQRWELPQERVLLCSGCGATVVLPPGEASAVCLFCGSAHVAVVPARGDLLQPWGLAPFAFDAEAALELVRGWLTQRRFRPADFEAGAWLYRPQPVYLPFWTFDVDVALNWSGTMLQTQTRRGHRSILFGPLATVTEQRKRISGTHYELFDDLLVPGGQHLSPEILSGLADFDTHNLVPYSPDFLASWPTEVYHVSLAEASMEAHAHARAVAEQRARASSEVDGLEDLSFHDGGIAVNSFKLVLLPVWLSGLEFAGRSYPIAVNGQTRTVAGRVPHNPIGNLLSKVFGNA